VFKLARPSAAEIDARVADARDSQLRAPRALFAAGSELVEAPPGYVRDFSASELGAGPEVFAAAREAILKWKPFDLGWVRVANSSALLQVDAIVAVEVHSFGLWSLNLSRIVDVIDIPWRFAFVYSTTGLHLEEGEERFCIILEPYTDIVWYQIEAFSRPRHLLARLGYPVSRHFQHRFARDSHRKMQATIDACGSN
jgi:uncharacterized protein (UPF0548 family)